MTNGMAGLVCRSLLTGLAIGNAVLVIGATLLGCIAGDNPGVAASTVAVGNWWLRTAFPDLR